MKRIRVRLAINGDGLDAEFTAGANLTFKTEVMFDLNDLPQPQVLEALGLRTSKPLPCRPSSKCTVEPSR